MKINPFTRVPLSLWVVAFIFLNAKTQSTSQHEVCSVLPLVYYQRLVPGVTTLVEAEAILGASEEVSSNTTEKTVIWPSSSDCTSIKAVFLKNGLLKSKKQGQKPKL